MNVTDFYTQMLAAAATAEALQPSFASPEAHCVLLAIAGQESGWQDIRQHNGPARGPWQFEINGVRGVLSHKQAGPYAHALAAACGVAPDPGSIFDGILTDMRVAYGLARLMLFTAPWPLPAIGDEDETLRQYRWCWRPGAWNDVDRAAMARQRWADVYPQAVACFYQEN